MVHSQQDTAALPVSRPFAVGQAGYDYFADEQHYRSLADRVLAGLRQGGRIVLVTEDPPVNPSRLAAALTEATAGINTVLAIACGGEFDEQQLRRAAGPSPLFLFHQADRLSDGQLAKLCSYLASGGNRPAGVLLGRSGFVSRLEELQPSPFEDGRAIYFNFYELGRDEVEVFIRRQLHQSNAGGGFAVDEINWIADLSSGDPAQVNRLSRLMLELTDSISGSDTRGASTSQQAPSSAPRWRRAVRRPALIGILLCLGVSILLMLAGRPEFGGRINAPAQSGGDGALAPEQVPVSSPAVVALSAETERASLRRNRAARRSDRRTSLCRNRARGPPHSRGRNRAARRADRRTSLPKPRRPPIRPPHQPLPKPRRPPIRSPHQPLPKPRRAPIRPPHQPLPKPRRPPIRPPHQPPPKPRRPPIRPPHQPLPKPRRPPIRPPHQPLPKPRRPPIRPPHRPLPKPRRPPIRPPHRPRPKPHPPLIRLPHQPWPKPHHPLIRPPHQPLAETAPPADPTAAPASAETAPPADPTAAPASAETAPPADPAATPASAETAPPADPTSAPALAEAAPPADPSAAPASAETGPQGVQAAVTADKGRAPLPLPAEQITALLARGDAFVRTRDIASARLLYERAADAGNGRAALRMGESFDPAFLDSIGIYRMLGDRQLALSWYRRACDLGDTEAALLLQKLEPR